MSEVKEEVTGMQSMFGKPDRRGGDENGEIQSEYPAYMMNAQIDGLDNQIMELESDLNGGRIPGGDIFEAKEELALLQNKFDDIVKSKPMYSPSEENYLQKELERMTDDMVDTLYSRYDQHKGKGSIARPQQEADLNDKPCIRISPEVARICNINGVVNGKASRNQIDKARKILCHYFGRDDASREAIRPENRNGRRPSVKIWSNYAFDKRHKEIFGTENVANPLNLDLEAGEDAGGDHSKEFLQNKIDSLKERISKLEGTKSEEVKDPNQIVPTKETPQRETKVDKKYICPEPDCGFVGKMTQKGSHVRMHNREKERLAKELNEEG